MKNLKILLILIVLIICNGCTSEYILTIDENNNLLEEVYISSDGTEEISKDYMRALYSEEYPTLNSHEFRYYDPETRVPGETYYDKQIKENNYGYVAKYSSEYNFNNYSDSRFLNTAFKYINVSYDDIAKYYIIELNNLMIFNAENYLKEANIKINIDDNFVVLDNNAASVNGNTYSWVFTSPLSSKILLRYQERSVYESNKQKEAEEARKNKIIIAVVLVSFVAVIGVIIILKRKMMI